MFEFPTWLAGGAILGLLAGFWDKIKLVCWKVLNTFIQQVEIPSEAGHDALVAYLIARYKRSRIYDRMYGAGYEYQRDGRYGLVPYEHFGNRSMIFWNGWFPFLFTINARTRASASNGQNQRQRRSDQDLLDAHVRARHARRRDAPARRRATSATS